MNALFIENRVISLANVTHIAPSFRDYRSPRTNEVVYFPVLTVYWSSATSWLEISLDKHQCSTVEEAVSVASTVLRNAFNTAKYPQ